MMKLEQTYSCSEADALARLQSLTDYWSAQHGLTATWQGGNAHVHGKVKGVKFDARVRVGGGKILADVDAGFLAEKLGGRKYVEGKLRDYMDENNSIEALRARVPQ